MPRFPRAAARPIPRGPLLFHDPSRRSSAAIPASSPCAPRCRWPMATGSRACCVSSSIAYPIELYHQQGPLHFRDDAEFPAVLPRIARDPLGDESRRSSSKGRSIRPPPVARSSSYISVRNGFPHEDVVQIMRDHGQRVFANLWTAGRVHFRIRGTRRSSRNT